MKNILLLSAVALMLSLSAVAPAMSAEWRLPVGLAYTSGFQDIVDQYEENLRSQGYSTDSVGGLPVGLSFQPYYEFDSGVGLGMGVGPAMMIFGDTDFFDLPLNLNLRYTPMPEADTSIYLRGGVSYNLASGDYVDSSQAGFLGALGVEFRRNKRVGYGFEVGYDSSTIRLDDHIGLGLNLTKKIRPVGFTANVFVVF